ncbi:MAG: biotin synthetase-like protein [Promethearchaeota archaeon CR_4]|nr:MAG: biotin synthetase-like protein [Candidatus Lokiarchaeota archaeon CR_4]
MGDTFDVLNFWNQFSWEQARILLDSDPGVLATLSPMARDRTVRTFEPGIKLFFPGSTFPAISITGDQCALQCLHCDRKYLKHMKQAPTPDSLLALCRRLDVRGAVGCLISGGCNKEGSVPLGPFLDAIATIKRETHLILNVHTGFLTPEIASRLGEIGIDVVSFDVNGSADTIREIYQLNRGVEAYRESMDLLVKYHVNFVPHICIGLHFGHLKGEIDALKAIASYSPQTIVFIILIPPTEGPSKKLFTMPNPSDIGKIFCISRAAFPRTELFLGCMRPGGKIKALIEQRAIEAGATSVVIPTRETQNWLVIRGIPVIKYVSCCAIPSVFYSKAGEK